MIDSSFEGRVAVITGAGKGLGKAYALWLAHRGCAVVVNNRTHPGIPSSARVLAEQICAEGGKAVAHEGAVDEPGSAVELVESAVRQFGKLDIIVCNAGVMPTGAFGSADLSELHRAIDVNLWGAIYPLQAAWRHMLESGYGRIVLSSSTVGLYGHAEHAIYGASRAAMLGLARSLALEAPADADIGVNLILPQGFTSMYAQELPSHLHEKAAKELPPEKVAPVVGWLCSEQCRVSGMMFNTGGGRVSRAAIIESASIDIESLNMDAITSAGFSPDAANEPRNAGEAATRMKSGQIRQ